MLDESHHKRDQRAAADPLKSGALPWLLAEFARIQAQYSAAPEPEVIVRDATVLPLRTTNNPYHLSRTTAFG